MRGGVAIISFVAALLVIGTLVLWLFQITASTSLASLGHYFSTSAFYAAESGLEMAVRELSQSPPTDIDSDGTIGTISDNGNDGDDPALSGGAFRVERVSTSPPTYRATGRPTHSASPWSGFRRQVEIETQ
jgi:hypothetical protein